jgi:hypothetical protein
MIHLMELPNPDPLEGRPAHGGRDRHTCVGERGAPSSSSALTCWRCMAWPGRTRTRCTCAGCAPVRTRFPSPPLIDGRRGGH